ncbi:hypothetical protein ACFVTX_11880 [Agromyces sp. NPDC058136]|uniref:hypothetical protein n=1 Tax=Agromyces sp. NPDC058136 TaxID=3346354 RepID=UPI0036DB32F0
MPDRRQPFPTRGGVGDLITGAALVAGSIAASVILDPRPSLFVVFTFGAISALVGVGKLVQARNDRRRVSADSDDDGAA